jgi:hypothetical protein
MGTPALACQVYPRPSGAIRRWVLFSLVLTVSSIGQVTHAFETAAANISFRGNTYTYTFSAVLQGSSDAVLAIVTDYDNLQPINDNIIESRVLERYAHGELKRILRLRQCILVFCFKLKFVEHISESGNTITATIIPAESNFRDGVAEWLIEPLDDTHTRLTLSATQTPDFWLPPIIGPLILKRVFMIEVRETCARIEQLVMTATVTP